MLRMKRKARRIRSSWTPSLREIVVIILQLKQMDHKYDPFKYPPDMQLARLHSRCSEPGDEMPDGMVCPCCEVQEKKLITDWTSRSMYQDFRDNGAVLSYFSLMRFYCATLLLIIGTYSAYQIYCISYACSKVYPDTDVVLPSGFMIKEQNHCVKAFGVWIISNLDLAHLMRIQDQGKLAILFILRSVVFLILVIGNMVSLVVSSHNRNIIVDISNYALFFKNINPEWTQNQLKSAILQLDPGIEIKDVLFLRKTGIYNDWYKSKIINYFALKDQALPPKKRTKLSKLLAKSIVQSHKCEDIINRTVPRAIVLFNNIADKNTVYRKYSIGMWEEVARKVGILTPQMYVTSAPILQDIIWENIGEESRQKTKMKVVTFFLMLSILGISYVFLRWGLILADKNDKQNIPPSQKLWSTFIALTIVALALVFRGFMNKLADMRRSNTKTSRTLFIVSTTVIYHFIYFLIIPTIYFVTADEDERSLKLFSVSYQALNFIIVQLLIVAFDMFYCCWDRGRTKILGKGRPGLCQKQIHQALTSPRFAIEFKLIIMFKCWSFATFYAFEVPYVLVLLLLVLTFIYVMDKRHAYTHYRLELIESKVEYYFLKIYSNFFTIYMCIVFIITQNLTYEIYIALAITFVAILFQLLYTTPKVKLSIENNLTLDEFRPKQTYQSEYTKFLDSLTNPELDMEIQQFAQKKNLRGVNTSHDDMSQQLIK